MFSKVVFTQNVICFFKTKILVLHAYKETTDGFEMLAVENQKRLNSRNGVSLKNFGLRYEGMHVNMVSLLNCEIKCTPIGIYG